MMKGRSGEVLWDDTIRLGIELRKKIRAMRREFEEKEQNPERRWFFEPFVPDRVAIPDVSRPGAAHNVAWETLSTDELATNPALWQLSPDTNWHGFPDLAEGFAMTDPNKLTLLTPDSIVRPAPMPNTASPHRSSRNTCAKTASSPRRTTSTPCSSCSRPASRQARPARSSPASSRSRGCMTTMRCWPTRSRNSISGDGRATQACVCATSAARCTASSEPPTSVRSRLGSSCPSTCPRSRCRPRCRALSVPQRCRLPADRGDRRPHRHHTLRGLSARHRHHRARRAADGAGQTHDRLSQDVRDLLQHVPGLRRRDPGVYKEVDANGRIGLYTYVVAE